MTDNSRDRRVSTLDPQYVKRTTNACRVLTSLTPRMRPTPAARATSVLISEGARSPATSSASKRAAKRPASETPPRMRTSGVTTLEKDVAEDIKKRRDDERG